MILVKASLGNRCAWTPWAPTHPASHQGSPGRAPASFGACLVSGAALKLGQAFGASAFLQVGAGEKKTPGQKHELSLRYQITQKGQGKWGAKNSPRGLVQALLSARSSTLEGA